MQRPKEVDEWSWEWPGHWWYKDPQRGYELTVGDCGVQMTADGVSMFSLGSEEGPKDFTVVSLYDHLRAFHLDGQFLAVAYLVISGQHETEKRFKST